MVRIIIFKKVGFQSFVIHKSISIVRVRGRGGVVRGTGGHERCYTHM